MRKGKKRRKAAQAAQIFEMVRISCHLSHFSSTKCLVLSIECINDYQGHANLIVQAAHSLQAFLSSFQYAIEQRIMQDVPPEVVAQRPLNGEAHISKHFQETFDFMLWDVPRPRQFMCLLEQFSHQVKLLSIMSVAQTLWNGHRPPYDFLL